MGNQSVGLQKWKVQWSFKWAGKTMEKVGLQGVPNNKEYSLDYLSCGKEASLPGSASINSVVCLWVRKSHLLLIIILNNSESGGDGKPTESSFQRDMEQGKKTHQKTNSSSPHRDKGLGLGPDLQRLFLSRLS
jgi:hypothetical protein